MRRRINRYPRITNDLVFGHVMSNKKNCLELLRRMFPELKLTKLMSLPSMTATLD